MATLTRLLKSLVKNRRGSVGITFSFAMVPLVTVLALATDYSLATSRKASLQQILDASALALARDPDIDTMNAQQINSRGLDYVKKMGGSPVEGLVISAAVSTQEVRIDGSGNVVLNFGGLFGQEKMAVKSSVTVTRMNARKLELSLALDNTGSMRQSNKIVELKKAVKAIVAYMQDPAKNKSPTKMAMVPFATGVRAKTADLPDSIFYQARPNNWNGCITDRDEPYNTNDTAPVAGNDASKFHWGTWERKKNNNGWHYGWNNNNNNNEMEYVAFECGDLARMIPLTSNLTTISAAADDLEASGNTNLTIGVEWDMHALTPGEPLTGASPENTQDLVRALIVLTDGVNTEDRFGSNNGGAIDTRALAACSAAKTKGIQVYTIHLIDGNAEVLKNCASVKENYFFVSEASQLTPVFEKIAGSLSKLRIAR
jgi:Flp pilus assembly protein TadG